MPPDGLLLVPSIEGFLTSSNDTAFNASVDMTTRAIIASMGAALVVFVGHDAEYTVEVAISNSI
jgi:hypothetical protein